MNDVKVNMENLSEAERKQLVALMEKANKKKWEIPPCYYGINGDGMLDAGFTSKYQKTGFCGQTVEQTYYIRDQLSHYAHMLHAWLEVVGYWRPEWGGSSTRKYYVYMQGSDIIVADIYHIRKAHSFYFPTKAKAQQWIDMVGEHIKELGL